jgi:hypothetical protein
MEYKISDKEWISNELHRCQIEEKAAVERIKTAEADVARAKAELIAAKEALAVARGGISEFSFQMKHLEENGRLP